MKQQLRYHLYRQSTGSRRSRDDPSYSCLQCCFHNIGSDQQDIGCGVAGFISTKSGQEQPKGLGELKASNLVWKNGDSLESNVLQNHGL